MDIFMPRKNSDCTFVVQGWRDFFGFLTPKMQTNAAEMQYINRKITIRCLGMW